MEELIQQYQKNPPDNDQRYVIYIIDACTA